MVAVFDATALLLLIAPSAATPHDANGKPITYAKERIDGEIESLAKAKTKIIIPTPALSEALVRAGTAAAVAYVQTISKSSAFRIEAFDERAALELAFMTQAAIVAGSKKAGSGETWAKVKFDRQIVAIAKVAGAKTIYTDDRNLVAFASTQGIQTIGIGKLPLPPKHAQLGMTLEPKVPEAQPPEDGGGA